MTIDGIAELTAFFLSLAALGGAVRLLHDQSVDQLRSDLFALRDEMFLYAVDHKLLDTEAYRSLRVLMNAFARYAHKFTATRVLLIAIVSFKVPHKEPRSFSAKWKACAKKLPQECHDDMHSFYIRHEVIVASHLVNRSLILKTISIILGYYSSLRKSRSSLELSRVGVVNIIVDRAPWQTMEAEAKSA